MDSNFSDNLRALAVCGALALAAATFSRAPEAAGVPAAPSATADAVDGASAGTRERDGELAPGRARTQDDGAAAGRPAGEGAATRDDSPAG